MKKISYLLSFIMMVSICFGLDVEKKPFIEHANAVRDHGKNWIALVRVKQRTSGYIDFELIEVLVGKSIEETEFRAYADPYFKLTERHSDEGTEWILDFFEFPVTIGNQTEKRTCYSAMNVLRHMKGLVYGQITQADWRAQEEMTMNELRILLKEPI